ncbi:g7157 [Coccomyxa viridis]|uniref:G7157 protein n=1 Tax=Coccomyxa viridis TaxID=1274662 RepID=A0ABP1FX45_9CHLO
MADNLSDQLALFNQYDSEYCSKATDVARKVQVASSLGPDQRRGKLREVEHDLREAEQIIKRMEMEARSFSPDRSRVLLTKVREYKADLAKLQESSKAAVGSASGGASARAELGLADDYGQTSAGQRERLLQTTDKMSKTGERITQGRQQLLETEELGVSILQDLHRQRQTISHARDTLHGADDNISRARRVLTSMSRRITTNKLIMIGIILLLLVSIFLVVYYKYIKK